LFFVRFVLLLFRQTQPTQRPTNTGDNNRNINKKPSSNKPQTIIACDYIVARHDFPLYFQVTHMHTHRHTHREREKRERREEKEKRREKERERERERERGDREIERQRREKPIHTERKRKRESPSFTTLCSSLSPFLSLSLSLSHYLSSYLSIYLSIYLLSLRTRIFVVIPTHSIELNARTLSVCLF